MLFVGWLMKVDKCMARLQELQYTVTGGTKMISGVSLSPRSTRGYLRTSLRCKQESLRYDINSGFEFYFLFSYEVISVIILIIPCEYVRLLGNLQDQECYP